MRFLLLHVIRVLAATDSGVCALSANKQVRSMCAVFLRQQLARGEPVLYDKVTCSWVFCFVLRSFLCDSGGIMVFPRRVSARALAFITAARLSPFFTLQLPDDLQQLLRAELLQVCFREKADSACDTQGLLERMCVSRCFALFFHLQAVMLEPKRYPRTQICDTVVELATEGGKTIAHIRL